MYYFIPKDTEFFKRIEPLYTEIQKAFDDQKKGLKYIADKYGEIGKNQRE